MCTFFQIAPIFFLFLLQFSHIDLAAVPASLCRLVFFRLSLSLFSLFFSFVVKNSFIIFRHVILCVCVVCWAARSRFASVSCFRVRDDDDNVCMYLSFSLSLCVHPYVHPYTNLYKSLLLCYSADTEYTLFLGVWCSMMLVVFIAILSHLKWWGWWWRWWRRRYWWWWCFLYFTNSHIGERNIPTHRWLLLTNNFHFYRMKNGNGIQMWGSLSFLSFRLDLLL